ncbi:MAG: hypothetical protein ACPLZF_06500 [Nitrososphaeria archaeon]
MLENVIQMAFEGRTLDEVTEFVKQHFPKMVRGEYDRKLILYRSLSRPDKAYKNIPHLRVLNKLKALGEKVKVNACRVLDTYA